MNENKKCDNYFPTQCQNVATMLHYDCCDLETATCDDCVYYTGQTTDCDWYVMTLDRKVIASSDPSDIGETY